MAGKMIEELKEAWQRDREAKTGKTTASLAGSPDSRVKVSVKGPDGRAYVLLTEPSSITPVVETTNQSPKEFAGIASITSDTLSLDNLEYHGFLAAFQEEINPSTDIQYTANINWNEHSTQVDFNNSPIMALIQ